MDDLDALLEEETAPSSESNIQSLIRAFQGPMPDFAVANPDERSEIVRELEAVRAIRRAADDRVKALELCITRAAAGLKALELRTSEGSVRVKPAEPGYETREMPLRQELLGLVVVGDLTREEVDAAIPEVISYKPDHRRLNGLLKRGERVRETVERNRKKRDVDLMRARVEVHREGGL